MESSKAQQLTYYTSVLTREHKILFYSVIALLTVYLGLGAAREAQNLLHTFDTGLYQQLLHNILRNGSLSSSVTGEANFFAHHFQPIILFLAPLFWLWPSATTLFAVSALTVLASTMLVFGFAKSRQLSTPWLVAITLSVVLSSTVANRIYYSFAPET